jgi:hypothetical protein
MNDVYVGMDDLNFLWTLYCDCDELCDCDGLCDCEWIICGYEWII